jgi:hypothetical protein
VVRLLVRVGAHDEAWSLHRCLLAAGKPSPLDDPGSCPPAVLAAPPLTGAEAVDLARVTLKNWV